MKKSFSLKKENLSAFLDKIGWEEKIASFKKIEKKDLDKIETAFGNLKITSSDVEHLLDFKKKSGSRKKSSVSRKKRSVSKKNTFLFKGGWPLTPEEIHTFIMEHPDGVNTLGAVWVIFITMCFMSRQIRQFAAGIYESTRGSVNRIRTRLQDVDPGEIFENDENPPHAETPEDRVIADLIENVIDEEDLNVIEKLFVQLVEGTRRGTLDPIFLFFIFILILTAISGSAETASDAFEWLNFFIEFFVYLTLNVPPFPKTRIPYKGGKRRTIKRRIKK